MAKLPSQKAAALAFAEVQTAIGYLAGSGGPATLRAIIEAIRSGRSSWEAVHEVTGLARDRFNDGWKKHLRAQKLRTMPDLELRRREFGEEQSKEQRLLEVREKRARRFLRLADMLRARRLTRAAIIEYEKAREILGPRDELVANSLGRAYLEIASPAQAISALMPVLEYYPELPGPQVTMGIAHLRNGNPESAARHLSVALRINPFDPDIHCGLATALQKSAPSRAKLHDGLCRKLR
jgi:tetratricopeptide (TPR) repeat protein